MKPMPTAMSPAAVELIMPLPVQVRWRSRNVNKPAPPGGGWDPAVG